MLWLSLITTESVINKGKRFGFSRQKALVIIDSIRKALAGWHDLITDEYARKQISKRMAELFGGIC
jgi:hypothetical protein